MYPVIIIAYAEKTEAVKLYKSLRSCGIFTKLMSFDETLKIDCAPDFIVALSKKYSSKAYAVLIRAKSKFANVKTIAVGDVSYYKDIDIDFCLKYTTVDKDGCVSSYISHSAGRDFTFAKYYTVASSITEYSFVFLRGTHLFFSENEAYIIHLLTSYDEDFISKTALANYMRMSEKTLSGYVTSINKNALRFTGHKLIFYIRDKGYSLFEPENFK